MILHFRTGDIEIEKIDYIGDNGSSVIFDSKDKLKLPSGKWLHYSPKISKKLFAKMKKEEMIRPVNKERTMQYYRFTKKALAFEGVYKL